MNQTPASIPQTARRREAAREVTRLAPSPTGALHLGNARTFLINWAMGRQRGWRIVMRIEDLDGPRVKAGAAEQALDTLRWLGLDWDAQPIYQSADLTPYHEALRTLNEKGLTYACICTRREIEHAQSAPHESDGELRYPGTCRERGHAINGPEATAIRVKSPDRTLEFDDVIAGRQSANVQQQVGDFVISTKAGLPAYQLAVVVDDARQRVTQVVRADDLLSSTARQLWLYPMLDLGPGPTYTHVPLVVGPDGRRLAKRHGDTRLRTYRTAGVSPNRIVGLLAYLSAMTPMRVEMSAAEFARRFSLDTLPRQPVTFTAKDERWLQG